MAMLRSPEDSYVKERAKWEAVPTAECPLALKPYEFKPYPAMFYRAERPAMGGPAVFEEEIVESDMQAANMRSRGFGQGQAEAMQMLEARERDLAHAAAHRAFDDKGMSEKAQREAAAFDESTANHVGEIPATPVRRGRPKKVVE